MVSVKSTEGVAKPVEGVAWPLTAAFGVDDLRAGFGAGVGGNGLGFRESSFTALLEMTNRRRMGGTFNFGAFGLLLRLVCDVCFAAVALRFNIINQTNEPFQRFRKININHREHAASDETTAFLACEAELRTPED